MPSSHKSAYGRLPVSGKLYRISGKGVPLSGCYLEATQLDHAQTQDRRKSDIEKLTIEPHPVNSALPPRFYISTVSSIFLSLLSYQLASSKCSNRQFL
jgi:hypothetical protein